MRRPIKNWQLQPERFWRVYRERLCSVFALSSNWFVFWFSTIVCMQANSLHTGDTSRPFFNQSKIVRMGTREVAGVSQHNCDKTKDQPKRASGRPNSTKLNDQTNSEARFLCDCSIKVLWELIFYNRGNCSIIYMSQAECGMGFVQGFWILYDFFLPNQVFPETKKIMIRRSHNHNFDYLYTGSVPDSQSWQTISWMTKVTKNMLSYYYCPELLIKFYFPQGLLSKSLS